MSYETPDQYTYFVFSSSSTGSIHMSNVEHSHISAATGSIMYLIPSAVSLTTKVVAVILTHTHT